MDINLSCTFEAQFVSISFLAWSPVMESNQRYYSRRAAEERTAAQRAMTAAAREWHAKLALQFAARASAALEEAASAA